MDFKGQPTIISRSISSLLEHAQRAKGEIHSLPGGGIEALPAVNGEEIKVFKQQTRDGSFVEGGLGGN